MQTQPASPSLHPEIQAHEQGIPIAERLHQGQYYTPTMVCDLMIALSLPCSSSNHQPLRVLEPGCGPGSFLLRLVEKLEKSMLPESAFLFSSPLELHGIELDSSAAQLAQSLLISNPFIKRGSLHPNPPPQGVEGIYVPHSINGNEIKAPGPTWTATIHVHNFIGPESLTLGQFDWIIGNPPYIRQEHLAQSNTMDKNALRSYLVEQYADYLSAFPTQQALFKQTADLYLWFFLQANLLLKPGGSLAFITSNSWLNTAYGQHFQHFLTHHFHLRFLAESACERWFRDAAVNPLIIVLEKKLQPQPPETVSLLRFLKPLGDWLLPAEDPKYWATLLKHVEDWQNGCSNPEEVGIKQCSMSQLQETPWKYNWALPLRVSSELSELLTVQQIWQPLETLGQVRYPLKTGLNAFFYLSRKTADTWGIEPEFLFPVLRSSRQVKHYEVRAEALQEFLFSCPWTLQELEQKGKTGALAYIQWGETQLAPPRQKRTKPVPWPEVPSVQTNRPWHYTKPLIPAHLFCPRFIDQRFFFPLCVGPVMEDQTFYGFTLSEPQANAPKLLGALLNSTLSYLLAEGSARTNLGEGVLQFARCDMARFSVLSPELFSGLEKEQLIEAFTWMSRRPILPLAEELNSPDRIALDMAMLSPVLRSLGKDIHHVAELRQRLAEQLLFRVQERLTLAHSLRKKPSANPRTHS